MLQNKTGLMPRYVANVYRFEAGKGHAATHSFLLPGKLGYRIIGVHPVFSLSMGNTMPPVLGQRLVCCSLPGHRLLLSLLLLGSSSLFAAEKPYAPDTIPGVVIISAEEVVELTLSRPELVIIDSRKKTEYTKGHIEGAVNLLNTDMRREDMEMLCPDKNRPIVFYCNGIRCLRSSDAIRKAAGWGYKNTFWFRGGWKEWTDKRLPIIAD